MTTANPISLFMARQPFHISMADQDITENYFDFSQCSVQESRPSNEVASTNSLSTDGMDSLELADSFEEYQTPAKPSFAYDEHKQTTGLPLNSLPGIGQPTPSTSPFEPFSNTGLDESSFMDVVDQHPAPSPSPFTPFSNTGLDESSFMGGIDNSFPASGGSSINPSVVLSGPDSGYAASTSGSFLTPTGYISSPAYSSSPITPGEASQMRQRVYPGMHKEMAEAQQRHTQQQQLQQQNLAFQSEAGKAHPSPVDREATITRVINSYRQQPMDANTALAHPPITTHVVKAKKDEEDMDEDEKLLASEEGKKLTSKERRQLRNKVSARAFRSRRKEYITQLEGDLNVKGRECEQLRINNNRLSAENMAYRRLLTQVIGQPQFDAMLQQLSHDPSIGLSLSNNPSMSRSTSMGQFSTSQMQLPSGSSWPSGSFMSTGNPAGRLKPS